MNRTTRSLTLSPYVAFFIITLVGSGATLALLHSIEVFAEYSVYYGGS